MEQDQPFEHLWSGTAQMEEWTQTVSHGAITAAADNIVTVHSTYFCGSVAAIRTSAGRVMIVKLRSTRSGAWRPSPLTVVVTNLRRLTPARPVPDISRATRLRPTRMPLAANSA